MEIFSLNISIKNANFWFLKFSIDSRSANNSSGRNLQVREHPQTGPYVVDLHTLSTSSATDAKEWLDIGNKRRATACTNMNQKSSRSHSVFQITLTQMLEQKTTTTTTSAASTVNTELKLLQLVTSRINLVDLAGSERINSSFNTTTTNSTTNTNNHSNNSSNASNRITQSRFKESTCINKSLLTLGKIISLLSERQPTSAIANASGATSQNAALIMNATNTSVTAPHLPYRDSVLTWLLKESLGGNAKTAMLATVCASSAYIDETVCTLRYAAKVV